MQTVWNFGYIGRADSVQLPPGRYKFECWGACGGRFDAADWTTCAKGGYTKGVITLKEKTTFHVYVGQSGYEKNSSASIILRTGFNGGGKSNLAGVGGYYYTRYGGGATDIRLVDGNWDNPQGLLSRIIVAGGGGGAGNGDYILGHGGGLKGDDGIGYQESLASGGTQYQGGIHGNPNYYGSFGKGGSYNWGNGGGGGWFGGSGCNSYMAGGGSGYALTKDSYKPTGYTPTSKYYLNDIVMTNGGNTTKADGYAKITLLQALPILTISSYNSTTATFKADHTDPTLLTKIEYFIDDVLKETITTDLTLEKTINYTLEDNALHTLKIVVTDSNNAIVEKALTISKGIAPLPAGSSSEEVANKWMEIKDAFKTGKTSVINTLALKNVSVSLDNTLVEFSEKIKTFFDSSDASLSQLQGQLTSANNTISQLNARYKNAGGWITPVYTNGTEKALVYNTTNEVIRYDWITINNLSFQPNIFYAECDYINSYTKSKNKLFVFACYDVPTFSGRDFVFTCDISLKSTDKDYTVTSCGLYYNNNLDVKLTSNLVHLPAFRTINAEASYYWRAIKIY
ncbi:glycine rich protein [Clostridioides difficile]|uniref:glycine rich domain-containing protein n=1 Tax=Clostridioides difficile TaxID=1496 RepID=UPI00097FDC78|nr:glycine rich domain-containing protein [Clostridioides difficile]SJW51978.1 glycine rich protein [Clostridioides difficile]